MQAKIKDLMDHTYFITSDGIYVYRLGSPIQIGVSTHKLPTLQLRGDDTVTLFQGHHNQGGIDLWTNEFGQLHREGGPAIIKYDGTKHWCYNGKLHRENGPAITYLSGTEEWYKNGDRHREGGPAVINDISTQWWFEGKLHRTDGPAIITTVFGTEEHRWYLHGREADEFTVWLLQHQTQPAEVVL